jgi:spore maturation protein A
MYFTACRYFCWNYTDKYPTFVAYCIDKGVISMIMGWIFAGMLAISIVASLCTGTGLSRSVAQGAQAGLDLAISIGGSLCLWSGVGKVMQKTGLAEILSRLLRPLLYRLFPSCKNDRPLREALSGNITANLLGLGNAATPLGIRAAQRLADGTKGVANGELCRLIVLNTASIQLLPTTVAAVRSSLGAAAPFDILPAVWFSSTLSVLAGLLAARLLRRFFP